MMERSHALLTCAHRPLENSGNKTLPMGADNLSIILPFPYEPYGTLLRIPRQQLCLGGSEGLGPAHPPPFPQRAITHVHISHSNRHKLPIT